MQQNPRYVPVFETDSGRGLPPALISHWCRLQCSTNWCSLHLSWRQTVILNSNLCKVQIFWQDSAGRAIKPHFDFLQNSAIIICALNQPTLWMTIDFSDDNCPWQEAFTMRQLLGFLGWRPQWVSCFSLPDCLHTCKIRVMAIVCDDLLWPAGFASSEENCWTRALDRVALCLLPKHLEDRSFNMGGAALSSVPDNWHHAIHLFCMQRGLGVGSKESQGAFLLGGPHLLF